MAPRAALVSALFLVGCFPPGQGQEPPEAQVYFPVGLSVSGDDAHRWLYIVNSDFDLQYNQGTVQSWDLDELRKRVPHYCRSKDECAADEVCDIYRIGEAPEAEVVSNAGVPSNWCVKARSATDNGDGTMTYGDPNIACGELGFQNNRRRSLYPGRCNYIRQTDPGPRGVPIIPVKDDGNVPDGRAVRIGAFATDVVRRSTPVAPDDWQVIVEDEAYVERLFIPVRGDATLHWIDVDANGGFECGQKNNDRSCDDRHRAGDDAEQENTRGERLSPEPFGLDADEDGFTLLVSNQTSGAVSLFSHTRTIDRQADKNGELVNQPQIRWDEGPQYVFRQGDLPERPMGVAALPEPLAPTTSGEPRHPGFLVTFRTSPTLALIRVYNDDAADPARPYTARYDSAPILTNSSGIDSRGLAIDAFDRKAEEARCLAAQGVDLECARKPSCLANLDPTVQDALRECLNHAAAVPLGMFVTNRAPSSVVLGRSKPIVGDAIVNDLPSFYDTLPLDLGPSRAYVGEVINDEGVRERRIFVVCFDSRRIAIYDPVRQRIETEIVTGRGPHAFAVDVVQGGPDGDHAYGYIGHFLDSYVGVVDLDQRHHGQYGAIIASVGRPVPPRASK